MTTPPKFRDWSSVEIFRAVSTGNDLGLPDSFVEYAALVEAEKRIEKLRTALEVYTMTNEIFPKYGDVAKTALAEDEGSGG